MGNNQVICGKFIGEEKEGESRVLRSAALADGEDLVTNHKGMYTVSELFKNAKDKFPKNNFLGTRRFADGKFHEYEWTDFETAYNRSHSIAKYLHKNALCPSSSFEEGEFKFIGLYAKNRAEWVQTDLACALSGITVVTLYDTLGKSSIEFIVGQTKIETMVL